MSSNPAQVVDPEEFIGFLDYQFSGDIATVDNKRRIVEGYRLKASIYHAAQYAGVHRATVYRYLDNDPQFAQAMTDSFEDAADVMETSTYEDALAGNALLKMFWLKAHRPKFRDRMTVDLEQVDAELAAHFSKRQSLPATIPAFIDASDDESSRPAAIPQPVPVEQKDK